MKPSIAESYVIRGEQFLSTSFFFFFVFIFAVVIEILETQDAVKVEEVG